MRGVYILIFFFSNIFPYMFSFFLKYVGCKIFLFRGKRWRQFCSYSWSLLVLVCVCLCMYVCVCVCVCVSSFFDVMLLVLYSSLPPSYSSLMILMIYFHFFFTISIFHRDVMETYKEKASQLFDTLMDDVRRNAVYSLFIYKPAPNTQP